MTTTELIYKKAQSLDAIWLQELNDFLDFLLRRKQKVQPKKDFFPAPCFEKPDSNTPYTGKPLSIEDMDNAINHKAGFRTLSVTGDPLCK